MGLIEKLKVKSVECSLKEKETFFIRETYIVLQHENVKCDLALAFVLLPFSFCLIFTK